MQKENATSIPQTCLLISVTQVSEILNISERTVWRLVSAGKFFKPRYLGRCAKWHRKEIEDWVESGCPAMNG